MSQRDLFYIISSIDDDLIAEAAHSKRRTRRFRVGRIAAIAAAAALVLCMSAYAATILLSGRSGHSSNIPTYISVPNAQTLRQDIGFVPNIAEKFSNGYGFKSGHISDNEDYGPGGSIYEHYKSLSCVYARDGLEIYLHADQARAGLQLKGAETADTYKGSSLFYYSYTNKIVPPDYQMTEQDKMDEASGRLVFTYGGIETEINRVQGVAWQYAGVNYELIAIDNPLPKEDLTQMAKEIIDIQGEEK